MIKNMESILTKAVKKAKMYGLPMIVYTDIELKETYFCSVEGFSNKIGDAEYVVLSDGSFEKLGTANVHHG